MRYPCLKVSQVIPLVKKLEKIKIIIKECNHDRYNRIEHIYENELKNTVSIKTKKEQLKDLDKRLASSKNKYTVMHRKLYDILSVIIECECCSNAGHVCRGDVFCLDREDNEKLWEQMDALHMNIINFYDEVDGMLVIETEMCFHKLNKISPVKMFD